MWLIWLRLLLRSDVVGCFGASSCRFPRDLKCKDISLMPFLLLAKQREIGKDIKKSRNLVQGNYLSPLRHREGK